MSFRLLPIMLLLYCCSCNKPKQDAPDVYEETTTAILQKTPQSRLYTAEYKVHKIVTHNDIIRLKGNLFHQNYDFVLPTGTRKLAFPLDVTLKAYVDLTKLTDEHIIRNQDKITIILPDPKVTVTSVQIDHREKKQLIDITRSRYSDEEIQKLAQQGVRSILQLIPDLGILETAQSNTAKTLIPILISLGYSPEQITIQFRKPFTQEDIPLLIDPENQSQLR